MPPDAATAEAAAETNDTSVCNFAQQITRTARRPLDADGVVILQLRLNKLAARAIRKLAEETAVAIPVCTTIQLPTGDVLTLVDVVRLARQ